MKTTRLSLPLPPSPNTWPDSSMARHVEKNRYRRTAWARALTQERPSMDPPGRVRVRATFYFYRRTERDEDNLSASLKWVLDTLTKKQRGALHWRQSLFEEAGYFVDDSPAHLTLEKPTQVRTHRKGDERLQLDIEFDPVSVTEWTELRPSRPGAQDAVISLEEERLVQLRRRDGTVTDPEKIPAGSTQVYGFDAIRFVEV